MIVYALGGPTPDPAIEPDADIQGVVWALASLIQALVQHTGAVLIRSDCPESVSCGEHLEAITTAAAVLGDLKCITHLDAEHSVSAALGLASIAADAMREKFGNDALGLMQRTLSSWQPGPGGQVPALALHPVFGGVN